jgi:hypothetical protein
LFAVVGFLFGRIRAADHFEPFAVVAEVFVEDGFGAAVAALVGRSGIVADAVEADAKVGAAFVAGFAASGLAGEGPFPTAFVAMTCHEENGQPFFVGFQFLISTVCWKTRSLPKWLGGASLCVANWKMFL